MLIHWFPGHMKKAFATMQQELRVIDCVIYVLDARAPMASINPYFDELITRKPVLYVLNKTDLVPPEEIIKWQKKFTQQDKNCIATDSTQKGGAKPLINKLREINLDTVKRYQARGIRKTVRAMVIGIPNCGKSTLINSLISRKKVSTANRPGVTRGKQWVVIDDYLELMDTPGTLYPDFKDQQKATLLAFIGSVRDEIIDINQLALEMIDFLKNNYPKQLMERYNLDEELSNANHMIIQAIAKKRGFILKGGELDIERSSRAIIIDFRRQSFGKVILEKV